MRYALHQGQRIAYDVFGDGPAVVLQHGFLDNRRSWQMLNYVSALADRFTLITIDSLGHGDSDKPQAKEYYTRETRVGQIAAVLDQEAVKRAHFVGYSMGGWLGMGMLKYRPDRLLSLTLGGWNPSPQDASLNPVKGMDIKQFLAVARTFSPEKVTWVTEAVKPALAACLSAFEIEDVAEDLLFHCNIPIHFWIGQDDFNYPPVKQLYSTLPNSKLSEVPGDHVAALEKYSDISAVAISKYLAQYQA